MKLHDDEWRNMELAHLVLKPEGPGKPKATFPLASAHAHTDTALVYVVCMLRYENERVTASLGIKVYYRV